MVAEPQGDDEAVGEDLLPTADVDHLRHRALTFRAVLDGRTVLLIISDYPLPAGFDHDVADLLVQLPAPGYPDTKPDMWWFEPWLKVSKTGGYAPATDHPQTFPPTGDRRWQRWSRHFPPKNWRPGVDGIASYLALVDRELAKAVS